MTGALPRAGLAAEFRSDHVVRARTGADASRTSTGGAAVLRTSGPERNGGNGRPAVLFSCSLSGTVLAVGAGLSAPAGRLLSEVVGVQVRALLHPSSHRRWEEVLRAAGEGSRSGVATFRLRHLLGPAPVVRASWSLLAGATDDDAQLVFLRAESPVSRAARRELRMQEAFGRLSREVAVVADAHGVLRYVSPAVGDLLGYGADAVVPWDVWSYVHPDHLGHAEETFSAVVDGEGPQTATLRVRDAGGGWRWVELVAVNLLDDDVVGGVVVAVHDITAEVTSYEDLEAAGALLRTVADTAEEGIWAVAAGVGTLYANPALAAVLGVAPESVHDLDRMSVLHPEVTAAVFDRTVHEGGPQRFEVTCTRPDGQQRRLRISTAPLPGEEERRDGVVARFREVTGMPGAPENDGARLPSRAVLDRLTAALAGTESSTAALLLDLDRFGMVNEFHGHAVGDRLLLAVGARLAAALSGGRILARVGGDRFGVVCEGADDAEAHAVARALLCALSEPFDVDGAVVHVAASVGISSTPPGPTITATDLLRRADVALQAAKSAGRTAIQLYDERLGEEVEHRHALSADLRTALADDALRLEFQPIVDLRSGTVVGLEALARWTHAERGQVPPDSFVPVAELTGLAPALDRWVIRRALHEMAGLREAGVVGIDAYLAVNVSACNLTDRFMFDDLLAWTEDAGLPAGQVVLEITETAVMHDTAVAVRLLRRLRDHGFRVAMDDFGAGHSSLAHLRELPISALKVDRSFIAGISAERSALAIVAAVVELGRAVGLDVIAEGVETAEQSALLRELGCDAAQGWLWSPAVSVRELLSGPVWSDPSAAAGRRSRAVGPWRRDKRATGLGNGLRKLFEAPRSDRAGR